MPDVFDSRPHARSGCCRGSPHSADDQTEVGHPPRDVQTGKAGLHSQTCLASKTHALPIDFAAPVAALLEDMGDNEA